MENLNDLKKDEISTHKMLLIPHNVQAWTIPHKSNQLDLGISFSQESTISIT